MNFKSEVSNLTSKIAEHSEDLSERADEMRRTVEGMGDKTRTFVRENPVMALAAAFGIGFILAKVARHA